MAENPDDDDPKRRWREIAEAKFRDLRTFLNSAGLRAREDHERVYDPPVEFRIGLADKVSWEYKVVAATKKAAIKQALARFDTQSLDEWRGQIDNSGDKPDVLYCEDPDE